jgi:predicted alpha-1,2-mannosidase
MKTGQRRKHFCITAVLWLAAFVTSQVFAHAQVSTTNDPVSDVNPLIGTGGDPDDGINLFPGAVAPFGMVQLSPDTEDHGFGYHSIQKWLKGFSMTHMSGPGCANEGDVFFTATTGPVVTQTTDFQTPYSHKFESAQPGYYRIRMLQWEIDAELTATERTGVARFTFPANKPANILLPLSHTLNQVEATEVRVVGNNRIEGYVEDHAFCNRPGTFKVYFVMLFDQPFSSFGTSTSEHFGGPGVIRPETRSAAQRGHEQWLGAYATWAAESEPRTITAKIGISYVDIAGAEGNLSAETSGKDFDAIQHATRQSWERELGRIQVDGGTSTQKRVFYTALYHSLLMPSLFSDADGRYLGFDNRIHKLPRGRAVYTNFSGWDIYRSEIPLLAMIEPQRLQDMAQSVVLMYQQGGWIDRWPQINLYTNDMIGSPLTIALATTWLYGLHGFDIDIAWQGMLKDATEAPPPGKPYLGEEGVEWVNELHYLPSDKVDYGSVAKTLEYSLAYASLYRLAVDLNKASDAAILRERALGYRNVFDPTSGFFRPRLADGAWAPDFNPAQDGHGFVEGTAWHYLSFAPADMAWLIGKMGRDRFNDRMTAFFHYPEAGWYGQYYNPFNETDFQAPYAFHFSGQPWKSQRVVRRVLNENYFDAPDGIPGNDDGGATSSWAVLSMMGLYTVDPTSLAYELVAPVFSHITVHLDQPYSGKQFTIESSGSSAAVPYIHSVTLDGKVHTQNWISFQDIRRGGTLQITLGADPDSSWGIRPEDAPPSLSREH